MTAAPQISAQRKLAEFKFDLWASTSHVCLTGATTCLS